MNTLSGIQSAVLDLLRSPSCARLAEAGFECLAENKGDIAAAVEAAVARSGACAMVATPSFKSESEASRSIVGTADVIVQVFETPAVNRARAGFVTALDAAELVAAALNLAQAEAWGTLVFRSVDSAAVNDSTILYNVRFTVKTAISTQE